MTTARVTQRVAVTVALLAGTGACASRDRPLSAVDVETIAASVDSATRAFETAQRNLDPERVLAHLAPDFTMLVDGNREGYATTVARIRESFATLSYIEPGFTDLQPVVVARDAAVVSFSSRDSVRTTDGSVSVFRGVTTLVWQRHGDGWLIRFAHAQHDGPGNGERRP